MRDFILTLFLFRRSAVIIFRKHSVRHRNLICIMILVRCVCVCLCECSTTNRVDFPIGILQRQINLKKKREIIKKKTKMKSVSPLYTRHFVEFRLCFDYSDHVNCFRRRRKKRVLLLFYSDRFRTRECSNVLND